MKLTSLKKVEEPKKSEIFFEFIKKLIKIRIASEAIGKGNFTQFLPFDDGIYAYFRNSDDETIMVISNASEKEQIVNTSRFDTVEVQKQSLKYVDRKVFID
jgi:glycosidase